MMDTVETPDTPETVALKTEVGSMARALAQRLTKAWNSKNAAAFASPFGKNADFIHLLGGHEKGRDAIARGHKRLFETVYKDSTIGYRVDLVRMITEDVALVFMRQRLDFKRDGQTVSLRSRPTALMRRVGSSWVVAHFQNTQILEGAAPRGSRRAPAQAPAKVQTQAPAEDAAG